MLIKNKITRISVVVALGVLVIAAFLQVAIELSFVTPTGDICQYNEHTDQKECTTYYLHLFLLIKVFKAFDALLITAIATTALAIFTWRLWWATKNLVEGTEETARKELRAYLGIPNPIVQRLNPATNHFQIQVTITNSGRTPARDVQKWMRCHLVEANESIIFENGIFDPAKRPIPPDSKWQLREDFTNWTDTQLNEVRHFRNAIYVWGEVTYKDIYGTGQTTKFRLKSHATHLEMGIQQMEGGRIQPYEKINGFDLEPLSEGNDAT